MRSLLLCSAMFLLAGCGESFVAPSTTTEAARDLHIYFGSAQMQKARHRPGIKTYRQEDGFAR